MVQATAAPTPPRQPVGSAQVPQVSQPTTDVEQPDKTSEQPAAPMHEAERRQLTILFCDLVGSSSLSERLDPEDMRNLLASYRRSCGEIVAECGGTIYEHLGDGIVVMFGYPVAHEDATQNAVRAGLQICEMFASANNPLSIYGDDINVRIGINTGRVVIGRDGAGEAGKELSVIGEVPNLASRLQEIAHPGQVVISQFSEMLLKDRFDLHNLGPLPIKGFSKPITCYQVRGVLTSGNFQSSGTTRSSSPLIGRDGELMMLQQHWDSAMNGDGQVLLLNGEAGVGKSRILSEFTQRAETTNPRIVKFYSSSFGADSVLRPVIGELRRRLALDELQTHDERYRALREALSVDQIQHLPALAALLQFETAEQKQLQGVAPDELKRLTFDAIIDFYTSLCDDRPMLMLFEDVHWCDPTTLEIISEFISLLGNRQWFLILAFRPDYTPPLHNLSYITSLTLNRFGNTNIRKMISALANGLALPGNLAEQIVQRADGIPLYAEELTRMVLDSGWVKEENGELIVAADHIELAIPDSLQDSLMARLDRFPSAREVAQIAATIGRQFSLKLLAIVTLYPKRQLELVLEQLQEAELVYGRGAKPYQTFEFKHALVQDAAYQSLLRSDRRATHNRIAIALETHFQSVCEHEPEILGRHFALGENHEKSCSYNLTAGHRALASSASLEAINHFENALHNLSELPQSQARDDREFDILVKIAVPQAAALGYAHEKVSQSYHRAIELAEHRDDNSALFPVIYGLVRFHLLGGRYKESLRYAESLSHIAADAESDVVEAAINRSTGAAKFYQGQPKESLEQLSRVIHSQLDENQRKEALNYDVVDLRVASLAYSGLSSWQTGQLERAMQFSESAIQEARKENHPFSLALACAFGSWVYGFSNETTKARKLGEETLALAQRHAFKFWTGWAEAILAWTECKQSGNHEKCISDIKKGIENWKSTRSRLGLSYFLYLQADLHYSADEYDEALAVLAEAEAFTEETDEHFWTPELVRLKADVLFAQSADNVEAVREHLSLAASLADRYASRSLKVKALTSLLRTQLNSGSEHTAADELRDTLAGIEGSDTTPIVREARDALETQQAEHIVNT